MGLTVYGGGGKPEEEKTVTAGTSTKVVTPSNGKTIKKVTVNPTPSQSKTVTPSTSQQTVSPDSGKLLSKVIVKAMEDVTPEVTAQTPIITQIAENFGVTITTPSGTNKQILQGNNANLLNIKNNAKKEGIYVWKKLTAQGGDFVDFVVSDNASAYPDGGEQGGYWYEMVEEKNNNGLIELYDYNSAGQAETAVYTIPAYLQDIVIFNNTLYQNFSKYLTNITIIAPKIITNQFANHFNRAQVSAKIKLKTSYLGGKIFDGMNRANKFFIPKGVDISYAYDTSYAPLASTPAGGVIYTEETSKPSYYGTYWNCYSFANTLTVMWGVTEEEFDAL